MNILQYVNSLQPVTEKRELLKSLDQISLEFSDTLMPVLDEVTEALTVNFNPKSNYYKKFDRQVRNSINSSNPPMVLALQSIRNLRVVIDVTKKEVKDKLGIQFTNRGMSYNKANIVKMVDALAFYVKYSRKFLMVMVAAEASQLGNATREKWSPAERDQIENSLSEFTSLIPTMLKGEAELKRSFTQASNALIEADTFALSSQQLSVSQTDPLMLNNFSPASNPYISLGKWWAEVKHNRYQLAKEELYGLQLRLEELRALKAGDSTNPVIQQQIQAYEKRISDYEYRIAQIEEKAGVRV